MGLSGVAPTGQLTPEELAREPRSLAVVAWFDGWSQALGIGRPHTYPRLLDTYEAAAWREGWADGKTADLARTTSPTEWST